MSAVAWPVRTARLSIRPATADDVDATWAFRRLPEVCEWLTHGPQSRAAYAEMLLAPARLASTLVIETRAGVGGAGGEVVGDLMLRVEDAWSQAEVAERARGVQAELGWVLHPDHAGRATPPRRSPSCSGSASRTSGCAGSPRWPAPRGAQRRRLAAPHPRLDRRPRLRAARRRVANG